MTTQPPTPQPPITWSGFWRGLWRVWLLFFRIAAFFCAVAAIGVALGTGKDSWESLAVGFLKGVLFFSLVLLVIAFAALLLWSRDFLRGRLKAKTVGTIALVVALPFVWWGVYRAFKPFHLSDLSGYDWSLVQFTVKPGYPDFAQRDGVKTMTAILFYPTHDRAALRRKARAVCRRCAAEMRRLLPNEHRAVKLTVYPESETEAQLDPKGISAGELTIDDPKRDSAIPDPKEDWHSATP